MSFIRNSYYALHFLLKSFIFFMLFQPKLWLEVISYFCTWLNFFLTYHEEIFFRKFKGIFWKEGYIGLLLMHSKPPQNSVTWNSDHLFFKYLRLSWPGLSTQRSTFLRPLWLGDFASHCHCVGWVGVALFHIAFFFLGPAE